MSTKKDKFSSKDKNYMKLALNLARARRGLTGDNPSVGCVIVKNDKIISVGQTGINGTPHAEVNAIKNSIHNISGSKMFVTLEPCNHYGKTPPCTKSIINNGIKQVYYSINDIDKRVKGKSLKILSQSNIKVKKGLLKKEVTEHYDSYFTNKIKKLPYVTGKIAISNNKLIYSKGIRKITDKDSEKLSHYLRFKNDALMISSKTLNIDNPKLNCRLKGYEQFSPIRVILDKFLDIKITSFVFKSSKKGNTIIFHNSLNKSKIKILKKKGINLIKSKLDKDKHFDIKIVLKKLFKLGIKNLLVEGGDNITKNLLKNRLFNQFYLFKSQKNLSKSKEFQIFTSLNILKKMYSLQSRFITKLAKDNITIYKR